MWRSLFSEFYGILPNFKKSSFLLAGVYCLYIHVADFARGTVKEIYRVSDCWPERMR